jgi:hypothetical protein
METVSSVLPSETTMISQEPTSSRCSWSPVSVERRPRPALWHGRTTVRSRLPSAFKPESPASTGIVGWGRHRQAAAAAWYKIPAAIPEIPRTTQPIWVPLSCHSVIRTASMAIAISTTR